MKLVILLLFFGEISAQKTNNCSVSFNKNTERKSDPRLIAGYNDVLGPIIDLTYSDSSLLLSADKLYPGLLRHPGGTVANYWNFSNASYVEPCSNKSAGNYNYCQYQARINKLPKQTFSPKHFHEGIGSKSPLNINNAHSIVYDLNILTLYDQQLIDQINILNNQIGINNVKYLELGNEYYLSNDYGWEFPNSQAYIKKATPLINTIRSKNTNSKIGVVTQRALPGQSNGWNNGMKQLKSSDFDAVTIHDYSASGNSMSEANQLSFIAVYGQSVIPQYIEYVHETFGSNKKIWMTEFNWNSFGSGTPFDGKYSYSVLHGIFVTSYIAAAICDTTNTMELLMLHEYSMQDGTNWGPKDVLSYNPADANNNDGATFNVIGQILAQINYVSMVKNNQMFCLNIDETGNNNQQCPILNVEIVNKKNLKCLYGVGFNNDQNTDSFGFVVVNGCHEIINIELEISTMINSTHDAITLNIDEYGYSSDGGISSKFVNCKENIWNTDCAAVKPQQKQINIAKNKNTVSLSINPISIIIANT